jgi:vitamin B12 transporter
VSPCNGDKSGAAPATVGETENSNKPLCARMGRRCFRRMLLLASPETGLKRKSGIAEGFAGGATVAPGELCRAQPPSCVRDANLWRAGSRGRGISMKPLLLPAAVVLLGAQVAHAAEQTTNLPPIVVTKPKVKAKPKGVKRPPAPAAPAQTSDAGVVETPTRTARPAGESISSVTVISHDEIVRSQAQSAPELLGGSPGIGVTNNGGAGKATSVFMRGTNADHVLVMIDGVKIGSATTGTAALQDLPAEMIDHVEIVRGPASSLYGSEAIGGVIQVFTRKGGPARTSFSITAGSYGTAQTSGAVSGGIGQDAWYSVGLSEQHTDGFNACKGRPAQSGLRGGGCWTYEPDRDGYDNLSGNARAGWRFASWGEAEVNAMRTVGFTKYDGTTVNNSETEQRLLATTFTLTPVDYWKNTLRAARTTDNSDNFLADVFVSRFNSLRDSFSWQSDIGAGSGPHLVTGVDWQNDRVDSSVAYDVNSRANVGVYGQFLTSLDAHTLQLSLRHDENEQFGGHVTGSAGWGYTFDNGLKLTASYGTAFKAPTFNQLYYPLFGNPHLRPESSKTAEVGVSGETAGVRWAVKVFETRVEDLIGYDATYTPVNIDTARIRGIETSLSGRLVEWDWRADLTFLDPENMGDGPNHGHVLTRRARESFAVHLDRRFGAWSVGTTVRGEGLRYDDLANTIELAPYAVVDLRAEYRIDDDWRLQFKLQNLLDRNYETAWLYNQPGRSAFVTLRYQH